MPCNETVEEQGGDMNQESREGSSPVCVRSVAAALRDQWLDVYDLSRGQRLGLRAISTLGPRVIRAVVERSQRGAGLDPCLAAAIDVEAAAQQHVDEYDGLDGPCDAILVGAPNGGAAHLANALGAPFLSQHFVFSFRGSSAADDVAAYQRHGASLAGPLLARNPQVVVINHYDPVHDRWLISSLNHIRLKLLSLPEAYRRFISARLRPGGALIFVDCASTWRQYRIGPRHTFQVGGLGGLSDQFYLDRWPLDFPLEVQPESEWGALPELGEALEGLARERGYRCVTLRGPSPEWFAACAYEVWRRLFERASSKPQGTLIEMFTCVNPAAVRASSLIPLWLPWNCTDSLAFLRQMAPRFDRDRPVLFTLLSNFSLTPDTVSWGEWASALSGYDARMLGQRRWLFPSDPAGLWRAGEALRGWCELHPRRFDGKLAVDEVLSEE
jgi:hypothetical protein